VENKLFGIRKTVFAFFGGNFVVTTILNLFNFNPPIGTGLVAGILGFLAYQKEPKKFDVLVILGIQGILASILMLLAFFGILLFAGASS
jgi:hypothetical protein